MGAKQSQPKRSGRRRRQTTLTQSHAASDGGRTIELHGYQKQLLRKAWQHMTKRGSGNVGNMIFKRMLAKNPEIKNIFQHVAVLDGVFGMSLLAPIQSYQQHSQLFVAVMEEAIQNLDKLDHLADKCREYGARHATLANYGMCADYWDLFGQSMTESCREFEGWRKHRETLKAWTVLVAFIVDRMRQGYEASARRRPTQQAVGAPRPQTEPIARKQSDDADARSSAATTPSRRHRTSDQSSISRDRSSASRGRTPEPGTSDVVN